MRRRTGTWTIKLAGLVCMLTGLALLPASATGDVDLSLEQTCVNAGLKMPKITRAELDHPGDKKLQSASIEVYFRPLPKKCLGVVERDGSASFQIERPASNNWISTGYRKMAIASKADEEGGVGIAGLGTSGPWKVKNPNFSYRCKSGAAKTQARALFRREVRNTKTGGIIDQRTSIVQLKIKRNPRLSPDEHRRGALRGAC